MHRAVSFQSAGESCRGELFLPDGDTNPPVVVMAHGFGGERTWGLPRYANRFRERGIATLLFDYRTFGESDGTPRNLVSPSAHLADWRAAIAHVQSRSDVDGDRIALWGTSFSGGHVIETAADAEEISAVVAQIPFTDGVAATATLLRRNGLGYLYSGTRAVLKDVLSTVVRGEPYRVPIVGSPDEFALLNTPTAKAGMESLVPDDEAFRNSCPARIVATAPRYRPISAASDIDTPVFVVQAGQDELVPSWSVDRLVYELDDVERMRLPIGHFDVYHGSPFERIVERQAAFLEEHLSPTEAG